MESSLTSTLTLPITLVDDNKLRGVLAPAEILSKELLQDIVDLIELSNPESVKELEKRIKEADRDNSWMSFAEVKKLIKKAK